MHNLQITDFGNYSCVADNGLGRDRASILLSGQLTFQFCGDIANRYRYDNYCIWIESTVLATNIVLVSVKFH